MEPHLLILARTTMTDIFHAIQRHDAKQLQALVTENPDMVHEVNVYGNTPLMMAVASRWEAGMDLLLPLSNPLARAHDGRNALMVAVQHKWDVGLECLVPRSDPKAVDARGANALMLAARHGYDRGLDRLLAVLPPEDVARVDIHGMNVLMMGAAGGVAPSTLERLSRLVDVNAHNVEGYTALMLAAALGKHRAVETLMPISDLRLVTVEQPDKAFKLALQNEAWACVDLLSVGETPKTLAKVLKKAPHGSLPRATARLEELALTEEASTPKVAVTTRRHSR